MSSRPSRLAARPLIRLLAVALVLVVPARPAGAESPKLVAEEVADDGVFVGFGRGDIDESALVAAVEDARFDGLRLIAVAPRDPQPDAAAFARRIQEQTDADAALVFPPDGPLETYVIEDLTGSRIRATEAARQFSDPARAVQAFSDGMNTVRDTGTPEIVDQIIRALVLLALVVGAVVAAEQGIGLLRRQSASGRESEQRAVR